jgi:hypothetical protein
MKTFRVTLRAPRDADDATAVRALRAILKIAGRRFRLRVIDAREISDPTMAAKGTHGFRFESSGSG